MRGLGRLGRESRSHGGNALAYRPGIFALRKPGLDERRFLRQRTFRCTLDARLGAEAVNYDAAPLDARPWGGRNEETDSIGYIVYLKLG